MSLDSYASISAFPIAHLHFIQAEQPRVALILKADVSFKFYLLFVFPCVLVYLNRHLQFYSQLLIQK